MHAGYRKGKSNYYKALINGQMKRLSKLPLVKPDSETSSDKNQKRVRKG
jgi:hypothetical protein